MTAASLLGTLITALEDVSLLRLERDEFLAAATGSPDGRVVAQEVAAAHLARDSAACRCRRATR